MIALDVRKIRTSLVSGTRQVAVLVSWAAVYFVIVLAAMTGLIKFATGWDAVVITSNSMSPTLHPGDVLFLSEHPDEPVGQQSVITFERDDGDLVTHRVFETNAVESSYQTKGDANPTPDADVVERDQVIGVGTLVVPYLALPVVWLAEDDLAPLVALGFLLLIAIVMIVISMRHAVEDDSDNDERISATAQRGISRVRLVVALMISMLMIVNGQQFAFDAIGFTSLQTLIVALAGLASISAIGAYRTERASGKLARRLATTELIGDTFVVVFFVAASGTSSIGWILMALPIIEAAIHFRLTGAFVHWVVMSGMSVGALFWTNRVNGTPQSVAIDSLEQLVDRLGVLLLVVIPGSYLAEQLLGDVLTQRRATRLARERSRIIERVTEAGGDVARLGVDLFPTLVEATLDLGFDTADCWTGDPSTGWTPLAQASKTDAMLPNPVDDCGGLLTADLVETEIFIDAGDPDPEVFASLAACGVNTLIRVTLVHRDSLYVVLRCGAAEMSDDPASQAMAVRLLCGQAAVALQNEQLLSELRATHAEIEHQARYDSLTELANRAQFVDVLTETLDRTDDESPRATVMFLDLNGFKAVNDRLGHNAGDALLRLVSQRLVDAVGERGLVARLGGDEFTVLLIDQVDDLADQLADAIHDQLATPFDLTGDLVNVGASVGIASAEPGIAVSELLRRADVSMYAAKVEGGRRRTMRYNVELDERERRSEQLVRVIGSAIANDELSLAYQPIIDTVTGQVVGVEALIRWIHEDFGPIAAPDILESAESADRVAELNAWIFRTALVDVATCPATTGPPPFVAVNVSPRELELEALTDNMVAALAASGLAPSRVVVELSERIVADSLGSLDGVDDLIDLGLQLALDDFGEGHTSLAHLRGLPITYLKLDRLFVMHAGDSAIDRTILRSVVNLAHDLGLKVIAEGVEDIDQHSVVAKAGSDYVQGYGLFRPMPIGELSALLSGMSAASMAFDMAELTAAMARPDPKDRVRSLPPPSPRSISDSERVG